MNPGVAEGASEISPAASKKNSKKPKYSRFTQQELPACKPILTPGWLDNFYQNHRRYVKSRSDKQLRSKAFEYETKMCSPEATKVVSNNVVPIVPCGLIAWSLFNDTYSFSLNEKVLQVNKKGIAWKSDVQHKFGSDVYPKNFQRGLVGGAKLDENIPLSEQEDLIVWMRTAALPNFRKLYGKIEVDLEANEKIKVVIQNNYNTYSFGGKKTLVLSTTSWIGGKNDFLGVAYLTVGGLCLFMAISFILLYVVRPSLLERQQLIGQKFDISLEPQDFAFGAVGITEYGREAPTPNSKTETWPSCLASWRSSLFIMEQNSSWPFELKFLKLTDSL
ncbi:hypothetical protein U1Q18_026484 [Sarracenia purpurea var. burkii]